ncbi:hypothetical protein STAQ_27700 [Allostella sp. ATCC 35155]|nr:hypothetical protein STAQ_27700 [Stella sp. ATCC 35155]
MDEHSGHVEAISAAIQQPGKTQTCAEEPESYGNVRRIIEEAKAGHPTMEIQIQGTAAALQSVGLKAGELDGARIVEGAGPPRLVGGVIYKFLFNG